MQKLAAYLLERHEGMQWAEARATEAVRLRTLIEDWIRKKGASEATSPGSYTAEDGSPATLDVQAATDGDRTWWFARLTEITAEGRVFEASISITNAGDKVAVYSTLEVGSDSTQVSPVEAKPKCPRIVRTLLQLPVQWKHGFTEIRRLKRVQGFDAGEGLAAELKHPERTLPFVVVSQESAGPALPDLDNQLAFELAGIANVVVVDTDAAWALTDHLGARLSCYAGAVRLYWPRMTINADPYHHPLWTATRLRAESNDLAETRDRLLSHSRSLVMRASALSVVRPPEIDDIRSASSRRAFAELRQKANSVQDHVELAALFEKDNDELRRANEELNAQVTSLQDRVAKLESESAALKAHLRAKDAQSSVGLQGLPSEAAVDTSQDLGEPADGDERYYKKKYSANDHDVMIRWKDCGHNRWQGSSPADKARKGIEKLEGGRSGWKNMKHCANCTGGGVWMVRW